MNERRKHKRWGGHVSVDLEDASGLVFEVIGLDVGAGGMCLIFPDMPRPAVDATYRVSFSLPQLPDPVRNEIHVRWVDHVRPKICGAAFVHGLRPIEVYTLNELIDLEPG